MTDSSSGASACKLGAAFFDQDCNALARALLGQRLVRVSEKSRVSGRIVEVECYLGRGDAASHSSNGKRTTRNQPMYMPPATAYVYSIYGMYNCFNISSRGDGNCVLVRALEPLEGQSEMLDRRLNSRSRRARKTTVTETTTDDEGRNSCAGIGCSNFTADVIARSNTTAATKSRSKQLKKHQLCNGPSKLCTALAIDKDTCNKEDLSTSEVLYLEPGDTVPPQRIVSCRRVGINGSGAEARDMLLRFYELGCLSVSVRDKLAEERVVAQQGGQPPG